MSTELILFIIVASMLVILGYLLTVLSKCDSKIYYLQLRQDMLTAKVKTLETTICAVTNWKGNNNE